MEFEHEGTKIDLLRSGEFAARVDGRLVTKPSLDAMKKFITLAGKTKFEPFVGLVEKSWNDKDSVDGLVRVNVTGVELAERATKYRTARHRFITDHSHRSPNEIMADSPENIAAYKAARDYSIETSKIDAARKKEHERLEELIKYVNANDYAEKKA